MKIRLIGISPRKQPVQPENGWYPLSVQECPDMPCLLKALGLTPSGLAVLRNGRHAAPDEKLDDKDEIQIFIKSLGG